MEQVQWIVALASLAVTLVVIAAALFVTVNICTAVKQGEFYFIEGDIFGPTSAEYRGPDSSPQWSGDGVHIVTSFLRTQGPTSDPGFGSRGASATFVVAADGRGMVSVMDAGKTTASPERSRLAFTKYPPRRVTADDSRDAVIGISDLKGVNQQSFSEAIGRGPIWSPQGDQIAFVRLEPDERRFFVFPHKPSGVFTVSPDGSNLRKIATISIPEDGNVKAMTYDGSLAWSSDSENLFFLNYEQDTIYRVDADGSGLDEWFLYPSSRGESQYPIRSPLAWSPDGESMAFVAFPANGTLSLFIVDRDGSIASELALTDLPLAKSDFPHLTVSSLEWSPDGENILMALRPRIPLPSIWNSDNDLYDQRLFLVNARSLEVAEVGRGSAASWSPDGSRIAVAKSLWGAIQAGSSRTPAFYEDNIALLTMAPDGSDVQILARYDWRGHLILEDRSIGSG